MPVRRQRTPDAQPVRPRLLLHHAPPPLIAPLHLPQPLHQVVPHNSRLHAHQPPLRIQPQNAVQPPRVQQHAAIKKLLPAHRVPSARNAQAATLFAHLRNRPLQLRSRPRPHNPPHRRLIQLRMYVIHYRHRSFLKIT